MKKRMLSMLCIVAILMSLCSVSALAATSSENLQVSETVSLMQANEPEYLSLSDAEPMGQQAAVVQAASITNTATITPEVYTDYLTEEGMAKYVEFTLDANHSVQLTLNCPNNANIDYDLALYTVDNDENITYVAGSSLTTYINGSYGTVAESCGYINSSSAQQTLAVFVSSTAGYSNTEPFSLVLCRDAAADLDVLEINDSAYTPSSLPLGTAGWTLSSVNLNVPNDQDWILCDTTGFESLTTTIAQNYTVDVYSIGGNGNQLQLCTSTVAGNAETFDVPEGYCYIRIGNALDISSDSFSTEPYSLTVQANPIPTTPVGPYQFEVEWDGDQGKDSFVNYGPYVDYAEGFDRKFRYRDTLRPTVEVTDANGNAVVGVTVQVILHSSFWSEASGYQYQYFTATDTTDAEGRVTIEITPQTTAGTWSILLDDGPHVYRHHVDIDTLIFYVEGTTYMSDVVDVYRLAYSEYISS